jgi:hypothetical protein
VCGPRQFERFAKGSCQSYLFRNRHALVARRPAAMTWPAGRDSTGRRVEGEPSRRVADGRIGLCGSRWQVWRAVDSTRSPTFTKSSPGTRRVWHVNCSVNALEAASGADPVGFLPAAEALRRLKIHSRQWAGRRGMSHRRQLQGHLPAARLVRSESAP